MSHRSPKSPYELATLTSLPTELIENIIIFSTQPVQFGPSSITALAQTCTLLRSLIYNTPDSHLWREIFLVTFDDPRELEATFAFNPDTITHDWEVLYKARMGKPDENAVVSATQDAPPLPPVDHEDVTGIVPLPKTRQNLRCSNSTWIDEALNQPHFRKVYENSHRIQWLYGPRYVDAAGVARRKAKVVVYNMRYLSPARCWGPFKSNEDALPVNPINQSGALEIFGVRLDPSDFEDPDYVDSDQDTTEGEDNDEEGDGVSQNFYPLLLLNHQVPDAQFGDISSACQPLPHLLLPDYEWLAAARLLIEENIRDRAFVVFQEPEEEARFLAEVKALRGLEVLRMGGAPRYWERSTNWADILNDDLRERDNGKGKEKEKNAIIEGWDWAGVEGEYR